MSGSEQTNLSGSEPTKLSGSEKTALVTGGAAGLGAAMVAHLTALNYRVISLDRATPAPRDHVVDIIADLGNRSAMARTHKAALSGAPYDLVVLNAGISAAGKFEDLPMDAMLNVLEINLHAPMALAAALLHEGALTPKGKLLFISSLSHFAGYPGAAAYAASKDGLAIYAKSLRKPLAKSGYGVSVAYPGPIKTDHAARYAPAGADAEKRMTPERAASFIIHAALAGKATIIPGRGNQWAAALGKIAPKPMTYLMRKIIYDKLDGPKL